MAGNKKDDLNKIGALFSKESKNGMTYFTGKLESGLKLVAFVSEVQNQDGDPMTVINIYEQKPMEEGEVKGSKKKTTKTKKKLPF